VDLAGLSFEAQIQIIHKTDILLSVHGAGLTHSMFLKAGSVVVEILPEDVKYKGFQNIAGQMDLGYAG
jgi:protein O-GlcNAc transferase